MTVKTSKSRFAAKLFAVIAIVVISAYSLIGCSLFGMLYGDEDSIEFTRSSLTLHVGDTTSLSDYIECSSRSYTLSSSNEAVATVSGRSVTARTTGVAYITAQVGGNSDRLTLNVIDALPDTLTVEPKGELIQTVGALSAVSFVPTVTGAISTSRITWSVNGRFVRYLPNDEAFEFTPDDAGIYSIKAQCGGITSEHEVRAYHFVNASVECTGELEQLNGRENIIFNVGIEQHDDNPNMYVQIFEDDYIVVSGEQDEYYYMPTVGRHVVRVVVNGRTEFSADVYCRDSVTPSKPTVVFDNMYPHLYVQYSVYGKAQVEIAAPTGDISVFSQNDSRYSALFSDNGFDAAQFISLCADSSVRRSYTIRVKSLGDGDAFKESAYSEECFFTQLNKNAEPYLRTRCLDADLYITSEAEYVAAAEYFIGFRSKTASSPRVSFDCYIGFTYFGDAEDLWNDAFPIAATSGMYTRINVSMSDRIMKTSFTVSTVNNPTRQAKPSFTTDGYSDQLHAILPHINYDEAKYRSADHVFPIDECTYEAEVTYSDELYLAAQRGVKPVPVARSAAETLYGMARDVLRRICTDDMTDMQKAHAIYDWIMWKVTYDSPAAAATVNGESYSAFYLEGVFGDGVTPIGGVVYSPYAVCDGMSKAYALMCNIEGIPCVRVVGKAGYSLSDAGGHAWNKVFVGGEWYIVDCTWGDSTSELALGGGRAREYELGLHDYLFLTDAQVSSTHFEPYRSNESTIAYAPKTTSAKYSVYEDMTYNGTSINCLIRKNENQLERVRQIARAFASSYVSREKINIAGGINGGEYAVSYQGIEIYAEDGISLRDSEISAAVNAAVKVSLPNASVQVYSMSNIILILVRA